MKKLHILILLSENGVLLCNGPSLKKNEITECAKYIQEMPIESVIMFNDAFCALEPHLPAYRSLMTFSPEESLAEKFARIDGDTIFIIANKELLTACYENFSGEIESFKVVTLPIGKRATKKYSAFQIPPEIMMHLFPSQKDNVIEYRDNPLFP